MTPPTNNKKRKPASVEPSPEDKQIEQPQKKQRKSTEQGTPSIALLLSLVLSKCATCAGKALAVKAGANNAEMKAPELAVQVNSFFSHHLAVSALSLCAAGLYAVVDVGVTD